MGLGEVRSRVRIAARLLAAALLATCALAAPAAADDAPYGQNDAGGFRNYFWKCRPVSISDFGMRNED